MPQNFALARAPGGSDASLTFNPPWLVGDPVVAPKFKLRNVGRSFLRRSRLVLLTVLLLNGLAVVGVSRLKPRYTADAALIVGSREEQVVDLKAVLSGLGGDSDVIESEVQVLRSRGIARHIVERYHLDQLPEFNPALQPPGLLARVSAFTRAQAQALLDLMPLGRLFPGPSHGAAGTAAGTAPPSTMDAPDSRTTASTDAPASRATASMLPLIAPPDPLSLPISLFLQRLDVASKGRSRVLSVGFTSDDPALAAGLANAVSDTYIDSQLKAKTDATEQAHQWLDQRVDELRQQMVKADDAVVSYRRRNNLARGRNTSLLTEQISELGTEQIHAREAVAVAQGRLSAVSTINANPLGLRQALAAAQAQEQRISADLASMRQAANSDNESEIELRALQQEADADRALYDRLLARAKETQIQGGLQQADAKIVSHAERPQDPSFPKPMLIYPAVFVGSCLIAALLVLAIESLDRGFSTVAQLEETLGLPAVGLVPLLKRREGGGRSPERFILDAPNSAYGEAIRSLHTSLMLGGTDRAPKVILVASALPGEGKTAVALSMVRMMASCGKRVVVVDCDLRRPALHKAFNTQRGPGLVEVLAGTASLDDVLHRDPISSASLLPAGAMGTTAPDLFASGNMQALLQTLSQRYDLVVIDCAPVLAVSDSRHLCRLADQTVFVVRWQETQCQAAAAALRQTIRAGGRVGGLLLSMVDLDKYSRYAPVAMTHRRTSLYLNQ